MAELERSRSRAASPAGELANERLIEAALEPSRYPDGTVFIGADEEHLADAIADAVTERRPLVIVYADGREIAGEPLGSALAFRPRRPSVVMEEWARILAHPARVGILLALKEGRASARELGDRLNLSPGAVSYQLRMLEKADAIEVVETKQVRGAVVQVYQAARTIEVLAEADWKRLSALAWEADEAESR
jgi:DNA-binding transcriptional ArsR family regulator